MTAYLHNFQKWPKLLFCSLPLFGQASRYKQHQTVILMLLPKQIQQSEKLFFLLTVLSLYFISNLVNE
jgi:hypothetical protein